MPPGTDLRQSSKTFRREPGQPVRLPARYRIRGAILRLPGASSAASATHLHRTPSPVPPRCTTISRGCLALLIGNRLPRLNVHFESTKWMAIRATPKRPRRNPTASLLPGRDSSTQHSASHLCNSHNQRRPSNTRRHGHCPDPTLLVSPYWLVIDRRLTCARSRSDLACGEMATALATIQRGVQTGASSISKPAEETL